jgi:hypothetical protein
LVGQGEGRPFVLILVAREFHSRRLRRRGIRITIARKSDEHRGGAFDREI